MENKTLSINKPLLNDVFGIKIFKYSEKSIVLVGEKTKELKHELGVNGLGGGWNKFLTDDLGKRFSGWIFPLSQLNQIVEYLENSELDVYGENN